MVGMVLFDLFQVKLRFRDKILGGVPRSAEAVKSWLTARALGRLLEETLSEVELVANEEVAWMGFKRDARGLFIESRQVKAMIKECAVTLSLTKEVRGLRQHLVYGTFVKPDRIYLGVDEPTGTMEVVGQVQSPRGPRSILKKVDYVQGPEIEFEIWTLLNGKLSGEYLRRVLELGQESGLGAMRTQGYGQFDVIGFHPLAQSQYA